MEIVQKFRLLFWALVLALWGMYMFQFFRPELEQRFPRLTAATDSLIRKNHAYLSLLQRLPRALRPDMANITGQPHALATLPDGEETAVSTAAAGARKPYSVKSPYPAPPELPPLLTTRLVVPNPEIVGLAPDTQEDALSLMEERRFADVPPLHKPQQQAPQPNWPKPAEGFAAKDTKHFTIYRERPEIPEQFVQTLDMLHGTLMLDLLPFSPWKGDEKVLLYFFSSPESYRKITGRPEWSVGAASLELRMIYLLEDPKLMGETAHELTHIYFDAFFSPGEAPLWLSEGMAVLMQTNRAMSPPQWLGENIDKLRDGAGLPLDEFLRVRNFDDKSFTEEKVRLWYAQSYSLALFLHKLGGPDAFYSFCKNLRDGRTM
ncbi:MAG TPA: hypothetical protein PLL10_07695, partial [Elusimicrobiales bacterium]|nr:hypothetical protein [Elusimicrobiales bacterium]